MNTLLSVNADTNMDVMHLRYTPYEFATSSIDLL